MRSIFRYPGGKGRPAVARWVLAHRPQDVREYREPFVGGGGVFFALEPDVVPRRWLNDASAGLMAVYQALAEQPKGFLRRCRAIRPLAKGESPDRLRRVFERVRLDEQSDPAFRFFFVNRTVYGGRVNYAIPNRLYFSKPEGWNVVGTRALEDAAAHLDGVRVTCGDFAKLLDAPGEGVWIYCDPPYLADADAHRTAKLYEHGFTRADHERLAAAVRRCRHRVALSYADDPDGFVRSLYPTRDGFHVREASWTYDGTKRAGKELLILNYDPPGRAVTVPSATAGPAPLDADERRLLARCEAAIRRGAAAFLATGEALLTLRDSGRPSRRLYRQTHGTFEHYCRDRWGLAKSQVYRLIRAYEVAGVLKTSPAGDILPTAERQLRELARLADDAVPVAWTKALEQAQEAGKAVPTPAMLRAEVDAALGVNGDAAFDRERETAALVSWLTTRRSRWPATERRHFAAAVREALGRLGS